MFFPVTRREGKGPFESNCPQDRSCDGARLEAQAWKEFRYRAQGSFVSVWLHPADVIVIQIPGTSGIISTESQIEDQSPLEIISVDGKAGDAPKSNCQVVQELQETSFEATMFLLTH